MRRPAGRERPAEVAASAPDRNEDSRPCPHNAVDATGGTGTITIRNNVIDFSGTTMPELATRTVDAARRLYGDAAAAAVTRAFADRGVL